MCQTVLATIGSSLVAQLVKNPPAIQETPVRFPGSGRSSGEGLGYLLQYSWALLVTQMVKNSPAMWETWVRSLDWEDPWRREQLPTPAFWSGELHGLYSPWGWKESDMIEQLSLHNCIKIVSGKKYVSDDILNSEFYAFLSRLSHADLQVCICIQNVFALTTKSGNLVLHGTFSNKATVFLILLYSED